MYQICVHNKQLPDYVHKVVDVVDELWEADFKVGQLSQKYGEGYYVSKREINPWLIRHTKDCIADRRQSIRIRKEMLRRWREDGAGQKICNTLVAEIAVLDQEIMQLKFEIGLIESCTSS